MNHLNPHQFRFPRSYREAFGVEHPDRLPDRVTFLKESDSSLGDALVGIAALLILIGLLFAGQ